MLIEFRVRNFRSIRDEQVLTLTAGKDKTFASSHLIPAGKSYPETLKSAVVYGANASGKSNLIEAFEYMRYRIILPINTRDIFQNLPKFFQYSSFKLNKENRTVPSTFEVTFVLDKVRYQYGFSVLGDRITEEWLYAYFADKPQVWFSRKIDKEKNADVYKFSAYLTGHKKTWEKATRADSLFLSTASSLNSEQLGKVFQWFLLQVDIFSKMRQITIAHSNYKQLENEDNKQILLNFIKSADINIVDIGFKKDRAYPQKNITDERDIPGKEANKRIIFYHEAENGEKVAFDYNEESDGTLRFFEFTFYVLDSLVSGGVLFVDELESNLHPLLVRSLVELFNSNLNKNGAQLVFTTHDSNLLSGALFRRDQIWFIEKDRTGASLLYPLTDFSPRREEALEKGYLEGRYGAIPFLFDMNFPVEANAE